jgi:hypothetical protein
VLDLLDSASSITLLTICYMIARGLAKAGSPEPYDDNRSH